jgi:hypothetical protein
MVSYIPFLVKKKGDRSIFFPPIYYRMGERNFFGIILVYLDVISAVRKDNSRMCARQRRSLENAG